MSQEPFKKASVVYNIIYLIITIYKELYTVKNMDIFKRTFKGIKFFFII